MNQASALRTRSFWYLREKEQQTKCQTNQCVRLTFLFVFILGVLPNIAFGKPTHQKNFPEKTITLLKAKVFDAFNVLEVFEPCPGGSGVIGGKIFQDYNYNGLDDQNGGGLAGIEVLIFGCDAEGNSQSLGSATSDANGEYFIGGLTDGTEYRVEFIVPDHLKSGFNGPDSRTTVQFVNSPSCNVNLGLASPSDFCEEDPFLAIPCYVNGDPLAAGSGSADEEALVMFKTSYEGNNPKPTILATAQEIGSTWGVAYDRNKKTVFASAFLKRHVGFGPLGIGGIYQIDISEAQPAVAPFIDVNTIGINVGTYPSNSTRGLTANINLPNNDTQAFNDVGKRGLGGMCMSENGSKLYLINLTEKKLHSIDIGDGVPSSSDVQSYTLPNPSCSGGEFRPFAVRMSGGGIYVGGVCDAEGSGNKSDLSAIVYRLDGNNFTEVLNFNLDYTKGLASRSCDDGGWFPWTNQLPATCFMSGSSNVIVHPTPHFTSIEFDDEGDMVLGFTDRMGNQLGFMNYPPVGTSETYSVFTGGDILQAGKNNDGSFAIENNGTVGTITTGGADNGEGPGGGEFYYWDVYDIGPNIPRPHSETAQGGLALIKGSGEIISTALDPFGTSVNSGGVNYFNNQTGAVRDPGYRVFRSGSSSPASFSKANGLGDLVALCGEAPIEIGGRLWIDSNENGIQDPCEDAFSGVDVALYGIDGNVQQVITTDANGEYYFNGSEANTPAIEPNTDYYVVIGFGDQFDNFNNVLLDSFFLTTANVGMDPNPDLNDSDGRITPPGVLNDAFTSWPSIKITTGGLGAVTHVNDAGFRIEAIKPKANISGFVWNDLNENGLQNDGEQGISGVTVSLYANNNTFITSTATNANGNYLFENVEGRNYYLVFDASNDPVVGDNFEVTLQDIGSDENVDSDINQSDARVDFEFEPLDGDAEFDAGFTLPLAQVVGFVFNDTDKDGLQGNNEAGIGGVTVMLYNADGTEVGTTTTDANGNYVFDNIMGGDYYVVVDVSTNNAGIPNYEGTLQDAGNDNFDSDVNPSTGQSDNFNHNPTNGNSDIDAGYIEPTATITGFVWSDLNENGLQNDGENGIPGVEVVLIDGNGNVVGTTSTDANGTYQFSDVKSDDYTLDFDASNDPVVGDNFEVTLQDVGSDERIDSDISQTTNTVSFNFNAADGNAEYDAGYVLPVADIMGLAFEDENQDGIQGNNEPMIGGVEVTLFTASGNLIGTTTTDGNGTYRFNEIMGGDYYIIFDVSTNTNGIGNYEGTLQDVGDDAFDSDVNPNNGQSANFNHNPANGNSDIDAGYFEPTATITGFVWTDLNENGLQNEGENGIPGVTVDLIDGNGTIIATTSTDANGEYEFTDVKSDNYTLEFDASDDPVAGDNFEVTLQDVGSDETLDSDISQTSNDVSFNFEAANGNADYDAGYVLPLANIMGLAFDDENKDGVQGNNEPMIGGVDVSLFTASGNLIGTTTTDGNGTYRFNEIMGGDYYIIFDVSTNTNGIGNYEGTLQDVGDDAFDSDVNPNTGRTNNFNFNPSDGDAVYDAGYFIGTGIITGVAFNDLNENGLQDAGEPGIPGIPVVVLAADGTVINSGVTQSDGGYSIDNIPPGTVTVLFDPQNNSGALVNFTPTVKDVNNNQNDENDSDINPNKESDPLDFNPDEGAEIDGGFFLPVDPAIIGDYVFKDCNENGIQDAGEGGIPNVPVTLRGTNDIGESVEMMMTTNSMGKYTFTVLRPGNYTLDFDIPEGVTGLEFSPKNRSGNSETDSDINPLSGVTDVISIGSGATNLSIDAGLIDRAPPLIFNVPPDVTVDCNNIPTPPNTIKGVDNCDPSVPVTFSERVINEGSCPYIIERTWTAIDDCGNEASRTQRITVTDTQAPVITIANPLLLGLENGGEVIFDCDNLPEFSAADVNATDDCSEVEVEFVDLIRETGDCAADGYLVKMTCGWIAEDECGNRSQFNIVIYVVDTKSPTLQNVPEDLTINADEGQFVPPFANTVTATDNCDEYVRLEMEQSETTGVCGTEITRTWIGYDDCGNKAIESQKITVLKDCTCPEDLVGNTLVWDSACDGSVGGMITLDLTADLNKYDISISPNTSSTNFTGNMFTDLAPGDYTVTVNYTAAETCSETYNFTIKTASPGTIEVVSQTLADCESANGSVSLSPANYIYVWSDGGTGAQRNDLAAGEYIVTFTDENMCQGSQAIIISNPDGCECIDFHANLLWEIEPTCHGYTNGQVDIEIIGGMAPYTYEWHDGQTTKDLFGVTGGPYWVSVIDANGCVATLTGDLNQPDRIEVMETLMNGACGEKGAIDIFISGGTPPYQYNWSNGATTEDLTNLISGTYTVIVTDANDCEGNLTVTVSNSGDINVAITGKIPTCAAENNGSLTATVTGGQNPLTYEWSSGQTTSTIQNIPAGTYAVKVTDATGCSAMAEMTLNAPDLIIVNATPALTECGQTTSSIALEVSGGTSPYSYSWSNGAASKDIDNLTEGFYEVVVSDANGCTGTANANITIAPAIVATATPQSPDCGGGMGGINLEVSGGRSGYTYSWSNGAISKDLTNIVPGIYSVTITDGEGCSITLSSEVVATPNLEISNSITNPACSGDGGSVTVNVSGGISPYTFAWSNGSSTKDLSDLTTGGYTLTVTDANGCAITTTAIIESPDNLTATAIPANPLCFGSVGSIDLTVSGGSGNYTYVWDFGATTEDIGGLISGDYTVVVTDGNGCQISATATIIVPDAIEGINTVANPSCDGEGGTIDLTVSGGTAPYSFGWSNGATTEDLSNAAPGSYNVLITDANGCTALVSAMVESVAGLSIVETITNPSCANQAEGAIDIDVAGGTAPYTYSWTNGATSKDVNNLMTGAYSVVVTDANGCQIMETYTLEGPNALTAISEVENPDCHDDTGKINITVSGGNAPYSFAWSNGATTEDLYDIIAGNYVVTITDANGCSISNSATLVAPAALSASTKVKDQDCSGDGTIDLTVTGGTPPYNYLWSNGATTEDLGKVGGGTYIVVITDANNCKLTHEVTVQSIGGIQILVSGTAPTCPDGTDGKLDIEVQGGTPPYTYQWSNGAASVGIANIPAGAYSVTVTDARGCTLVGPAVLDPAPTINATLNVTNPSCVDAGGSIDLAASGGVGTLTFQWSNGATTEDINDLIPGGYTVTISDGNGCSTTATAVIESPTPLLISAVATNLGCDGSTGNISLSVSGGTSPYIYAWSNGSFDQNLNSVPAGTYSVTVVDANGCEISTSATIEMINNISVNVIGSSDPTCAGGNDGFINIEATGGTPPYNYNWTNGATTAAINGLAAGIYAVTVTDSRDCKLILDAVLNDPAALNILVEKTNPACPSQGGNINITVMGGTPPYAYAWNNGATTQDLMNVGDGNYQVIITDAQGCTTSSPNINIASPDDFSISLSKTDISCYAQSDGSIQLTVTGSHSYTYAWSNGATTQNLANLSEGTYSVVVTNENGCQKTAEMTINMPPSLSMGMTFTNPNCPDDYGAIDITVAGGTPPYTYAWSNGATTEDVSNLPVGNYTVVITDANGCTLEGSSSIRPASAINVSATTSNQSCDGMDGSIDLNVSGGSGIYTYVWNTGATSQDLSGLAPGTYEVTVTDTKGCKSTNTAVIEDDCICPNPLINQNMVTNARCGEANGFIMIVVNGNVSQFQFEWSPNVGTQGAYNNERSDLPAGTYDVTVTFAGKEDCQEVVRLAVGNKDGLSGSVSSNIPADCGKNNGRVILTPGVNYIWPDGSSSQNRGNLTPGTYVIKTLDGSGCEGSVTVTVNEETCEVECTLEAEIVGAKAPDCDGHLGSIDLEVTGGKAPYVYEWGIVALANVEDPSGLVAGTYSVLVTDAGGCTVSTMVTLNEPDCSTPDTPDNPDNPDPNPSPCDIILSLQAKDMSCDDANDGKIGVNVLNGLPPYTYKWSNGATTNRLENLRAGEYQVEVIDANGCRAYAAIRVNSPGRLVVTETRTVLDCEKVEIKLNVRNGRAPYKWICEDQQGSLLDPLNLAPGVYNCVVMDGSGCSVNHELVIEDYQPLEVVGVVKHATCGQEDGTIDLTPIGGTAPYEFTWDCGLYGDEDQFNLGPHTYNVTITDATNCEAYGTFTIEDCGGAGFGFVTVNAVSNGDQTVNVSWEIENEMMEGNYVVFHSLDGENYDVIGAAMKAKGPIDTAAYTMTETVNFGKNYFMIKYIDEVGNEYFSEVTDVVVFLDESTGRVSIPAIIYPNPTSDEFTLDFARPIDAEISVMITDIDGVVVRQVQLAPGTPKQLFDITSLESGIYQVTLQQRRKRLKTYRLVKAVE